MASHIAKNYPQFIDFLFVDRSLGSLEELAKNMILGSYNQRLFSLFSRGWVINSAQNFYDAQCFKMLTQDPNDDLIDKFGALNCQVAKVACSDNIGDPRYYSLKLEKVYNALRLLYLIENKMFLTLK